MCLLEFDMSANLGLCMSNMSEPLVTHNLLTFIKFHETTTNIGIYYANSGP